MHARVMLVVLLGVAPQAADAEEPAIPLSPPRIAGEVLGGAGTGLLGALVGMGGMSVLCDTTWAPPSSERGDCFFDNAIYGAYAGYVAFVPIGVALVGTIGVQTGSLRATYAGGLIGGALGALAIMGANGRGNNAEAAGAVFAISAPMVGALVGFNLTRRYDQRRMSSTWTPTALVTPDYAMVGVLGEL